MSQQPKSGNGSSLRPENNDAEMADLAPAPVARPFYEYEAQNIHRIGHFDANGTMQYEKQVRLNGDKTRLWIMTKNGSGEFSVVDTEYDIRQHVGIRFEKDANGYYWLKLQSAAHAGLTKFTLTYDQGVEFEVVTGPPKSLNFIGADDIRTLVGAKNFGPKASAPLAFMRKSVQPGEVAGIQYIDTDPDENEVEVEIEFWCND